MEVDDKCGKHPYWVCNDGLKCVDNICKFIGRSRGPNEDCTVEDVSCEEGMTCIGPEDKKKCKKLM